MLLNLLWYDWRLNRLPVILFGGFVLLNLAFWAWRTPSAGEYVGLGGFIMIMIPLTVQLREDKLGFVSSTLSLPVTRSQVVLARYLEGWIGGVIGLLVILAFPLLFPFSSIGADELLTLRMVFGSAFALFLPMALLYPFIMRFGQKGLMIAMLALNVLGVAAMLLLTLGGGHDPFRVVFHTLPAALGDLRLGLGDPSYYLLLAAFLAAANGLSYLSSRALLARKDL